jgi:enoyl-CoA hydratase/carnithine racemase
VLFRSVLGTRRLAHRIGADRAREILSASRTFGAEEAHRIGFLTGIAAQSTWPQIIEQTRVRCEHLSPGAAAALHRQTTIDTRADDMAALVHSVSKPGLKERIRLFREQS